MAALDAAVKEGVITGVERIRLLTGLNKDGDFELVNDEIASKRKAAEKKPAPKAAPLSVVSVQQKRSVAEGTQYFVTLSDGTEVVMYKDVDSDTWRLDMGASNLTGRKGWEGVDDDYLSVTTKQDALAALPEKVQRVRKYMAATKPVAKPAPKAAAPKAAVLKKGKPALTYEAVRQEITDAADTDIISQDQYDTLIAGVDRKTSTPDRIKAQLDYLIRGGTIKKVAPGEARGLREQEREVVREAGPAEVAEDLTAADTDYREMNVQANEALTEGKIKPLQFRELQNMIFQRRPLPAIRKAFRAYQDMIMERTGDTAGDGITVAEAEAAIKRASGAWKTQIKTKVWENFEAVPADLRMQLSGPTVLGFYDATTNTVHVIAGNHLSGSEAVATVYHEILGHRGLRDRFGKRALSILNAIYRTNKEVKDSADQYLKRTGKWDGDPNRYAYAVEEVLAMASESGRFRASLWQRLVNLVREFGRRIGFNITYNNADVATILAMAHDSVIEGTGRVKGLMRAATDAPLMERQARIDELVDGLPSSLQNPVRTVTDTFGGAGTRTVSRFGLMNQLIDLAVRKGIRSARRFARLSRERGAIVERQQEAFVKWAEDHAALPAQYRGVGAGTVNGLIEAMTRQEAWAFEPNYFTGEDRGTKVKLDPDLVEWYNSMPAEAQKSVREALPAELQLAEADAGSGDGSDQHRV